MYKATAAFGVPVRAIVKNRASRYEEVQIFHKIFT